MLVPLSLKNHIKREGDGDPAKMVRLGLIGLYGRETLLAEDLTAKGLRTGQKGMKPAVREALLGEFYFHVST